MDDKKVIEADQEVFVDVAAAQKGMSDEAKEEFAKRVIESRKLGKRSSGSDAFIGKTIDILAMGPGRGQCPFDNETWGVNTGWKQVLAMSGKIDKLFIVHTQVYSDEGNPYFVWEKLNEQPFEIINIHRIKGLKSKLFPLKRICEKFDSDYLSDSICYMIAYALHLYTRKKDGKVVLRCPLRLRLFGVDMQDFNEYQLEKGGIEYWLGYARGLGVEYSISFGSTLLTTESGKPYGIKTYRKKDIIPHEWRNKKLFKGGKLQGYDVLQREIYHALSRGLSRDNPKD